MKLQVVALCGDPLDDPAHRAVAKVVTLQDLYKERRGNTEFAQGAKQKTKTLITAIDLAVDELAA